MQQNKHIMLTVCALVCAVLLITASGIGQTQARYDNTVSRKGIYMLEKPVLESNFLAEGGQTVLLSDWNITTSSYRVLDIQLEAKGGSVSGTLSCQVDSDLLSATLDQTDFTVQSVRNHAMLTLARTAKATAMEEKTTVTVRVSWTPAGADPANSTVWADFTVNLLPGANGNAQSDGTQYAREAMEVTCSNTFCWDERLVMKLTLPENADTLMLSYEGVEFPENTRYFVDSEEPRVLGDSDMISIPANGRREILVLLDFSWTDEASYRNSFLLSAMAYAGDQEIAAENVNISASRQPLRVEAAAQGYILKGISSVQLSVEGDMDGFIYTVEQLTSKNGVIAYTESEHLRVTVKTTNNSDGSIRSQLVISNDNGNAPAGTYRLTLQRTFDGVVISSFEIPIFVCY